MYWTVPFECAAAESLGPCGEGGEIEGLGWFRALVVFLFLLLFVFGFLAADFREALVE